MSLTLLLESVQNAVEEARGYWWTLPEASSILNVEEEHLRTLIATNKRKPQTLTQATGVHLDHCQLNRGERRTSYIYIPKYGEAPSSTMHSEAERELRPDYETVCRLARRQRRSSVGTSEGIAVHKSALASSPEMNHSSKRKSLRSAQFSSAGIAVISQHRAASLRLSTDSDNKSPNTAVTCASEVSAIRGLLSLRYRGNRPKANKSSLQAIDLVVGDADHISDEAEHDDLLHQLSDGDSMISLAELMSLEKIFSNVTKCIGASPSLRLVLMGCRYRSKPQLFVRCNGFTSNRIAFTSNAENLLGRLGAFKTILVTARKRVACDLSAHSTHGHRITGVSDERATGNSAFFVRTEPSFRSTTEAALISTLNSPREKEVITQAPELIGHVIRARGCCRVARVARGRIPSHISVCPGCSLLNDPLNEAINSEMRRLLQPISPYIPHSHVAQFPDLAEERLGDQSSRIRKLEADKKRLEALRFVEEHGDEMDPDPLVSQLNDVLLSVHGEGTRALEEAGCGDDTLEHQIWNACVESARAAQASGSKQGVRYPRFVIRFAMGLLAKVGKNTYESLRQAFHLPTGRYLRSFASTSSSDPDGIMFEALEDLKTLADRLKLTPSERRMFLAFDGCNLKSGVFFDANKNKIVGFASDVFEDVDIMEATRQFMRTALEKSRSKPDVLPLAATYMVFYLSAVQPEVSLKSPIARFCISNSKACWLLSVIPHVIAEAYNYSFRVVAVVCDGATENRSTLSALATVPAGHFLRSMEDQKINVSTGVGGDMRSGTVVKIHKLNVVRIRYDLANDEGEDDFDDVDLETTAHTFSESGGTYHRAPLPRNIPLDQMIAFEHPLLPGVYVFFLQDMPHVVKRVVNALEMSNPGKTRVLTRLVNGQLEPVCLKMIYDAWSALGGQSVSQIRFNKLTVAHFVKDAYSRMRVSLAVQILSASTARMLEYAVETPSVKLPAKQLYGSVIECCKKFNRLVDIMNGAGVDKGAPLLNSPHAPIVYEALDSLGWLSTWKCELVEAELDLRTHFFPKELYADISGMILALACMARHECHKYPGTAICQRRGQQDIVEHHFAHARGGLGDGRNMMAHQATQRTSLAQAQRAASQGSNCEDVRIADNSELPSEERRRIKRRAQKAKAKLRLSSEGACCGGGGGGAGHGVDKAGDGGHCRDDEDSGANDSDGGGDGGVSSTAARGPAAHGN